MQLTWILGIFWAHILVASIQHILVHECSTWSHLSEERDLDGLANLDSLSLLHEDLPCVLASVLAIERGHTILLRVVPLLERLQGSHEVVPSRNTRGDDTLGNTGRDSSLDDRSDGVHGSHNLVLELRRHMQLDLLEEVLRSTETTDDKNVLKPVSSCIAHSTSPKNRLTCNALFCA